MVTNNIIKFYLFIQLFFLVSCNSNKVPKGFYTVKTYEIVSIDEKLMDLMNDAINDYFKNYGINPNLIEVRYHVDKSNVNNIVLVCNDRYIDGDNDLLINNIKYSSFLRMGSILILFEKTEFTNPFIEIDKKAVKLILKYEKSYKVIYYQYTFDENQFRRVDRFFWYN